MFKLLALALSVVILGIAFFAQPARAEAQRTPGDICIARWTWLTEDPDTGNPPGLWAPPFLTQHTGTLDLRTVLEQGTPGPLLTPGFSIFSYDQPMGATGMHCIGDDLNQRLTPTQQNTVRLLVGLAPSSLAPMSVAEFVTQLLVNEGEPTGTVGWKPVRMTRFGFEIHLGDHLIAQQAFSETHPAFQNTIDVRWADYRRHKLIGTPLDQLQAMTGLDSLTIFGRPPTDRDLDLLLPTEHRSDGWRCPPGDRCTIFTDSFTDTDNVHLENHTSDTGQAWAIITGISPSETLHIVSNTLQSDTATGTGQRTYYITTAMGGNDQRCDIDLDAGGAGDDTGILIRGDGVASGWDSYYVRFNQFNAEGSFRKYVNNTDTFIESISPNPDVDPPDRPGGGVVGTTLTAYVNGSAHDTATDSTVTTGQYVGLSMGDFSTANMQWDDLECDDFISAASQVSSAGFTPMGRSSNVTAPSFALIQTSLSTGGGTQDITSSGFGTPQAAIITAVRATTPGTIADDAAIMYGVTDGTNQWVANLNSEDGVASTNSGKRSREAAIVQLIDFSGPSGGLDAEASGSLITDGLRLSYSDAPSQTWIANVILIRGMQNVLVGTTALTGLTTVDLPFSGGFGFEADIVMAAHASGNLQDATTGDFQGGIGFSINEQNEVDYSVGYSDQHTAATSQARGVASNNLIMGFPSESANSYLRSAQVDNYASGPNRLRVTRTDSDSATSVVGWLAMELPEGIEWSVHLLDTPTSTGTQAFTGAGYNPGFAMVLSSWSTAENTVAQGTLGVGISAFTEAQEIGLTNGIQDNVTTMVAKSLGNTSAIIQLDEDGTLGYEANFVSMDPTGWTLNWTTVDGSARKYVVLAIEGG